MIPSDNLKPVKVEGVSELDPFLAALPDVMVGNNTMQGEVGNVSPGAITSGTLTTSLELAGEGNIIIKDDTGVARVLVGFQKGGF